MAGLAKSNSFMLGTATVMLGAPADLMDLHSAAHSIGLVKNFQMTNEPAYTELTQGVKNTIVYSVLTGNPVRSSMEVYEFTAKNLNYGLGLDGSAVATLAVSGTVATGSPVVGDDTEDEITLTSGTSFNVGDWITIAYGAADDHILLRKITAKTTNVITVNAPIPTGITIPGLSVVKTVNKIGVGAKVEQPFLAAKIIGTIADGSSMTILIPKLRISKGFTLAFQTNDYGNLPFEFTVYDLVDTDPFFAEFGGDAARIFKQ